MKTEMTIAEMASMGGKAKWKNTTKKQRSEEMKRVRAKGLAKLSTAA